MGSQDIEAGQLVQPGASDVCRRMRRESGNAATSSIGEYNDDMGTFSGFNDGVTVGAPASLAVLRGEERVVISVNREFCHAFGLAKESTEGRPVSEVVSLDGLEEVISQTRLPGEPMGHGGITYTSTEGVERRYLACANPLDGDTLVILNDITEQRRH